MNNKKIIDFVDEIYRPIPEWRIIYIRSLQTIRSRFARSYLGQFWMTISLSLLIIATGLVWSLIWGVPAEKYLPYVSCGHVIYLFVSGTINESTGAIISDKGLFYQKKISLHTSIYILLLRNTIVFVYNIPIMATVILWSNYVSVSFDPFYMVYILVVYVFLFFCSYILSLLCVYYRDLIQLIASILNVAFLLTPVIWEISLIPDKYKIYVYLNPFASSLELLRNPLIGRDVDPIAIICMLCWCIICIVISWFVWRNLSKKAIYWI